MAAAAGADGARKGAGGVATEWVPPGVWLFWGAREGSRCLLHDCSSLGPWREAGLEGKLGEGRKETEEEERQQGWEADKKDGK